MFISRKDYEEKQARISALDAANHELNLRTAAQQATIDWLIGRVNQVEMERAQLFERYTGVKLAVPEIKKVEMPSQKRDFDAPVSFEDMGDVAAGAAGIGWNDDGTLKV